MRQMQLDLFGDYLVEDEYDVAMTFTATEDLLSHLPDDSVIWFANEGEEVIGINSPVGYSPNALMFTLLKTMRLNQQLTVDELMRMLSIDIYHITAAPENEDNDS